jgi:hypothetical protein
MGTPQVRWREMHQSGRLLHHALDARPAPVGHEVDALDRAQARSSRRPLLSMPMNHCGVARKMIGVLWRQQCG